MESLKFLAVSLSLTTLLLPLAPIFIETIKLALDNTVFELPLLDELLELVEIVSVVSLEHVETTRPNVCIVDWITTLDVWGVAGLVKLRLISTVWASGSTIFAPFL